MSVGRTLIGVIATLAVALPATAGADPLRDAQAAFDRGKYATALELWQPLAEQGDPEAQSGLGNLYVGGYGVARDEAAAMAWFRKAAEQGDARGQFGLGSLHYARREYGPAASWYRRAAEQGDAVAQIRLGRLYADGVGVARDDVQAFKWFAIAAVRGADSYARGNGAKGRDDISARMTAGQVAQAERLAREWQPKAERPRAR